MPGIQQAGEGEYEYLWRNPVTRKLETEHAHLGKVGQYLVAVGYYSVNGRKASRPSLLDR